MVLEFSFYRLLMVSPSCFHSVHVALFTAIMPSYTGAGRRDLSSTSRTHFAMQCHDDHVSKFRTSRNKKKRKKRVKKACVASVRSFQVSRFWHVHL